MARSFAIAVLVLAAGATAHGFDLKFDYTSFDNPNTPGANPHFGHAQFDVLNYPSLNGHYLTTSTDNHRPKMVAHGNTLAQFYNFLQARYNEQTVKDGAAAADVIHQYTLNNSTRNGPRPDWIVLNEISASLWPPNAGPPSNSVYRTWLIDVVTRLHDHYGYNVLTLAPFQNPGANDASWQALAAKSYIGAQCYLSGTEVWNSGSTNAQRLAWAQSQYQASKNSYLARGVPASRLFVIEHFANNNAVDSNGNPVGWGRAGLASADDWSTVIQIRQDAIFNVGFSGFMAYAWGGNAMGVTEEEQIQHEHHYRSRRVLASQRPQWLSDGPINVNGTAVPLSWNQPLNWLGGVPNAPGAEVNFWRTLTAGRTITLDGSKTVGRMMFDSAFSYTIGPGTGGSIVFNNSASPATLTANQGSHTIGAAVQLVSNLTAAINSGTVTINGAASGLGGITKLGAGTLVLNGANTYAGDTHVQSGMLRLATASLADAADVYLNMSATLHLAFSGADVVRSLFINGASQPAGTWGAPGSGAQFTTGLIVGSGWLSVTSFVGPSLAGDFNGDGVVDAADYVVWRKGLGTMFEATQFDEWRANFGQSAATPSTLATVPEPPGLLLVGLAFFAAARGLGGRGRGR